MRPGEFITKEAVIDRFVHHWMYKQPTCCLWGVMGLNAPLSDEIIEKALRILINTVPILSARLKTGLWRGHWEFAEPGNIKTLITRKTVADRNEADRLLKEVIRNPIAVDHPPLIRITSIDLADDHYLILQVHHNIMDGEGSKQLFDLFAKIYRELEKDPRWLPDTCPDMNRSWLQMAQHQKWHRFVMVPVIAVKELIATVNALLKLRKAAAVIIGDYSDKNESTLPENPQIETFVIHDQEIDHIKTRLKKEGAKVNDLIMAALMTTVNAWNFACGETFSHVLSVYTVNLRRWLGQPEGSFANMSAIYLVEANREDLVDVHGAVKTLKNKFDKAKKNFGLKELWDLIILKIQPELISRILSVLTIKAIKKTHALTNIGIIPESAGNFGRVQAKSYSLVAPPMPSPNLLFTVSSYNNNLTVHCSFNETHMKPETAKKLMGQFKDNMLAYAR
jgi:NRPS condensation-like uncharacterized protein